VAGPIPHTAITIAAAAGTMEAPDSDFEQEEEEGEEEEGPWSEEGADRKAPAIPPTEDGKLPAPASAPAPAHHAAYGKRNGAGTVLLPVAAAAAAAAAATAAAPFAAPPAHAFTASLSWRMPAGAAPAPPAEMMMSVQAGGAASPTGTYLPESGGPVPDGPDLDLCFYEPWAPDRAESMAAVF
jgi:hypothetical protein